MKQYHPLDVRYQPKAASPGRPWQTVTSKDTPWAAPGPIQDATDGKARAAYRDQLEQEELARQPWYFALVPTLGLMAQVRAAWVSRRAVAKNIFAVPLQIGAAVAMYFVLMNASTYINLVPVGPVSLAQQPSLSTTLTTQRFEQP